MNYKRVVELSRHTVYQSPFVTIHDVLCDDLLCPAIEQALDAGSVAFIRYGIFALNDERDSLLLDANYAFFAGKGISVIGAHEGRYACTIVQYNDENAVNVLRGYGGAALCTSRAYLMQARLLNSAWLGRPSPAIDDIASQLFMDAIHFAKHAGLPQMGNSDIVRSIKALVNRSLSKPLSLTELARTMYLSPFTISRVFHRETGVSLREYVKRLRLRTALSRILDGVQATYAAAELGFWDESHFSKAFHAEFGSAPAFALGGVCDNARR